MNYQDVSLSSRPRTARQLAVARWLAMIGMAWLLLAGSSYVLWAAQTGLVTKDLTDGTLTAQDLANELVGAGGGVTISNVVYTGTTSAAGTFSGGTGIIGFERGIILSSGNIMGVVGPNTQNVVNYAHNLPGDPDLTTLAGHATHDAAVLTFDFVPNGDKVFFNFVFSSDEYNGSVNGEFNDVFAFYVNGTNCALVAGSGKPVSINTINKGKTGTEEGPESSHPELYRDNPASSDGTSPINTGMNGLTTVLNCAAPVKPNETNTMKLAIADSADHAYDANVFIEAGSLSTIPPTPTPTTAPTPLPTSTVKILPHTVGDVHIRTPDGLVYDFQAVGDFILMQSTTGDVVVQARQESWVNNPRASINTAVALWVGGDKLEFYLKPERRFFLNDVQTELPASDLALPQGGSIVINPAANATQQDFTILWPDGNTGARVVLIANSHLDIGVARLNGALTYAGVLGNLDNNRQNDLQIRNGDQIAPPASIEQLKSFGDSWRVAADESLFLDAAPIGEAVDPLTLRDLDPTAREQAQQTCQNAGITDPLALDNCIYDVTVTGDPIFVESAQVFEESIKALSPCARVPAQYETLGQVFAASQTDAANITIMDGDDLEIAVDESENGTRYLRFNIYRNAECVASFSVGTNAEEASALTEAVTTIVAEELPSTLTGQVVDIASGGPLTGAQVCIQGTSQCASTDDNGNYALSAIPPGEQVIEVSAPGYLTASQPIAFAPNATAMQDFALTVEQAAQAPTGADPARCREGLAILQGQLALAEEPAAWLAFYVEIEQEFLVGCVGLDDAIAEAAAELGMAALGAELGIAESDLELLNLFSDGSADSLTGELAYVNSLVSAHCPESAEGIACSDILMGYDVYLRLAGALVERLN